MSISWWRGWVLLALLLGGAVGGQTAWEEFGAGRYASYAVQLNSELAGRSPAWLERNLVKLLAAAIATDKLGAWGGELDLQVGQRLADSPAALRYYAGMSALVRGRYGELGILFDGQPPDYSTWRFVAPCLAAHGYAEAASVATALHSTGTYGVGGPPDSAVVKSGIVAIAGLPAAARQAIWPVYRARVLRSAPHTRAATRAAVEGAIGAAPELRRPLFEAALDLGRGRLLLTLVDLRGLLAAQEEEMAALLVPVLAQERPTEVAAESQELADVVWRVPAARRATYLADLLALLGEPRQRELRLAVLRRARGAGTELLRGHDLLPGDAALVADEKTAAAAAYLAVLTDRRRPLGVRLDAWAGCLEADAARGADDPGGLVQPGLSAEQIHWLTGRLASSLTVCRVGPDVTRVRAALATLLLALQNADPGAALDGDARSPAMGQRVEVAAALLSAGYPAAAADTLLAETKLPVPPPDGGWLPEPGAAPHEATSEHRLAHRPRPAELRHALLRTTAVAGDVPQAHRAQFLLSMAEGLHSKLRDAPSADRAALWAALVAAADQVTENQTATKETEATLTAVLVVTEHAMSTWPDHQAAMMLVESVLPRLIGTAAPQGRTERVVRVALAVAAAYSHGTQERDGLMTALLRLADRLAAFNGTRGDGAAQIRAAVGGR